MTNLENLKNYMLQCLFYEKLLNTDTTNEIEIVELADELLQLTQLNILGLIQEHRKVMDDTDELIEDVLKTKL